jgi:endonuclease/exonuclease/phosphatase family metal-dependent hydrolase
MHVCRAAVIACASLIAGCAAAGGTDAPAPADPEDCGDREGPCVQTGTVATPDPGTKVDNDDGLAAVSNALPTHYPFWVLQMNLCNSGIASCYQGGRSVPEAATVIQNTAPDVVTLNEICQDDVVQLSQTLSSVYSGSTVVWGFKAAQDRRTSAPYKCKNGQDYGIGLIAHIPGSYAGHDLSSGIYASQDPGSAEERAWLCIHATGSFYACTTHLASTSGTVALNQCKDLMTNILPSVRTSGGENLPTVIGGDLNMKFKGSPNAQDCVPAGFFRKGDGDVQHIMATTSLAFSSSRTIAMSRTDHDGWFVALTAP